ncbi:MAG TPA: hypothetical protein VJN18_24645 [Polyangiaceae bacterium]|nr:hypothetical protein [Polyangiaceae bacterium]
MTDELGWFEKGRLLLTRLEIRQADTEQPDGLATLARLLEDLEDHRKQLELRAGGRDGVRALQRLEIGVAKFQCHGARLDAPLAGHATNLAMVY